MLTRAACQTVLCTPTYRVAFNLHGTINDALCDFSTSAVDLNKQGPKLVANGPMKGKSLYVYTKKFMGGGMQEPKLVWNTPRGVALGAAGPIKFMVNRTTQRRINNLNQVFLDGINDILSSGVLGADIGGRQLTISKVRVLENLTGIVVHWFLGGKNNTAKDIEAMETMLKSSGRAIRQELVNQRLAGHVPPLTFKQDDALNSVLEVESILNDLHQQEQLQEVEVERRKMAAEAAAAVPDAIFDCSFEYKTAKEEQEEKRDTAYTKYRFASCFFSFGPLKDKTAPSNPASYKNCRLSDGLYGVSRGRIMAKIEASLSRAKAMGDKSNSAYPFLIKEPEPARERQPAEEIRFATKSSLRDWAASYARRGNFGDKRARKHGDSMEKDTRWLDRNDQAVEKFMRKRQQTTEYIEEEDYPLEDVPDEDDYYCDSEVERNLD